MEGLLRRRERKQPPPALSAVGNVGHMDRLGGTTHIKRKFYETSAEGKVEISTPTRLRSEPVCGAVVCA